MITRIITKRLFLYTQNIAFFSKDPFEKFNRKKQPKQPTENIDQPNPNINAKLKPKVAAQNLKSQSKEHQADKIGKQRARLQQIRMRKQRELQQAKKSIQEEASNKAESQSVDDQAKNKKQSVQQPLETAFNRFNKKENKVAAEKDIKVTAKKVSQMKGFQKFNKLSKQEPKEDLEVHKKEEKKISHVKIDLKEQEDDNEEPKTTVLRKQSKDKKKRPNTEQKEEKKESQELKESAVHQTENKNSEDQIWRQFQRELLNRKLLNNKMMRIERRQMDQMSINKGSEIPKKQAKVEFTNHRTMLLRGVGIGILIVMLSSNQYFVWRGGKERDPQDLTQMLQSNRVVQTWTENLQTQTDNDQNLKGKNFKTYIYVRQQNGNIYYCTSNSEFEKIWFNLVSNKNMEAQKMQAGNINNNPYGQITNRILVGPNVQSKKSNLLTDTRSIFSFILFYFFVRSLLEMGKGGPKGKNNAGGLFDNKKSHRFKETISITFKDVVGMQKSKGEIVEFIDFLKFPAKYQKLGAKIPKGALLTGPPGTGKTMIAKACAGQSKVPFYTISGSEFIEMYVGVGAQRVRDLFKEAKQNAPSIIFIDQIDAVGKKRSGGMGGGGNDERDTTLNQLLVEMDGFDVNTNVIVFAATNQKQVLDAALTRPGRFDRMIEIDLPDLQGRKQIFQVHLKPIILDSNIQIEQYARRLATLTPGFSGADIKNVCNEAAIIAARNNKQLVSVMDFQLATERIIGGVQKKSQLITEETRKIVAYHECGHGVVSWFIENANPLLKLTIIPRSKGALGFAQYLPNEHQMFTKAKLIDEICVILGGRVAEQVFFGKISTGASDDLKKAYDIAKKYVTQFGFGEKVGWLQYNETEYVKQYSKETEDKIDQQIMTIMQNCSKVTKRIVKEKQHLIHNLASKLLQMQTIDQTIIQSILGQRPFKLSKQHEEYIQQKKKMAEEISIQTSTQKMNNKSNYIS